MRLTRSLASAIGLGLLAASAIALSAPAAAAAPGVTYVTSTQVALAPATGWVRYDSDTVSSSARGLLAPDSFNLGYALPAPITATSGTAVTDFAAGSSWHAELTAGINATIVLTDASGSGIGLNSVLYGTDPLTDPAAEWTVFGLVGTLTYGSSHTLAEIDSELSSNSALAGWTISTVILYVDDEQYLHTARVNGEEFSFLPQPVSTAPATVSQASFAADGVTVTTSGFVPGESIEISYSYLAGGVAVSGFDPALITADPEGVATYTLRLPPGTVPDPGAANITFLGQSGVQTFDFAVTAAAALSLAATGTDALTPLAAGGVLLLAGAALAVVAMRGRRTV